MSNETGNHFAIEISNVDIYYGNFRAVRNVNLQIEPRKITAIIGPVSYTHLRAHETPEHLVCRLLLEKKKTDT